MELNAPTVRRVFGKLSKSQLNEVKTYSESHKFSQSWYWHGPEGAAGMDYKNTHIDSASGPELKRCGMAIAFNVEQSTQPGHFWGAKVDQNLMKAMEHVSEASGGDVGTVNYILEYSQLSHEEFVAILDDSLNGVNFPEDSDMPKGLHESVKETFLDRNPTALKRMDEAPTVKRILSAFSKKQLGRVLQHSIDKPFHHGWYWFGPEGDVGVISDEERFVREGVGDPIAVAFELTPSRDAKSWRGCKLDENFVQALEFWAKHTGGEIGMEDYVVELNSLSSEELDKLVRSVAAEALSE